MLFSWFAISVHAANDSFNVRMIIPSPVLISHIAFQLLLILRVNFYNSSYQWALIFQQNIVTAQLNLNWIWCLT